MANIKFSINKETLLIGEKNNLIISRVPNSGAMMYTAMPKANLIGSDEKTLYFNMEHDESLPIWDAEPSENQIADYLNNNQDSNSVKMTANELYDGWYEYKNYNSREEAAAARGARSQKQNEIMKKIENTKGKSQQQQTQNQNKSKPQEQHTTRKQEAVSKDAPRQKLTEQEKWEKYRASIKHYSKDQFREIRKGIRQHLDTMKYRDINLSAKQMKELRLALKAGVDISTWNSPFVSVEKMKELRLGAKHGIRFDMNKIDHRLYDAAQLKELRLGFEKNLAVKEYLNPAYSAKQMHEIRLGLQMGLDIHEYADVRFSLEQMQSIRKGMVLENIKEILMHMWEKIQAVVSNVVGMVVEKMQADYTHREFRTPEQVKQAHMNEAIADIKYTLVEYEILKEDALDDQELEFKIREQVKDLVHYMENHPEENIETVAQEISNNIHKEVTGKENIQNNIPDMDEIDKAIDQVMENQIQQEEVMEVETFEMQM
ncbi:MAG: hypothetical protein ACI4F4_06575 [Lachnospiraceae bacterium]